MIEQEHKIWFRQRRLAGDLRDLARRREALVASSRRIITGLSPRSIRVLDGVEYESAGALHRLTSDTT